MSSIGDQVAKKAEVKEPKKALAVVQPAGQMAEWEQLLAAEAKDERAKETLGLPRITHQGGVLQVDGEEVEGNEVIVATVEYAFGKEWYKEKFVPGKQATPGCYAFGPSDKGMVPHESAPEKQNPTCTGCKWNEFGSADVGRGKACKDVRRLMVILASDLAGKSADAIGGAEVRQLSVPPASLGNFAAHLAGLPDKVASGNLRAALTKIAPRPRKKGGHELTFTFMGPVPKDAMPALLARRKGAYDLLTQPFPVISDEEKAAPAPRSKKF